MKSPQLLAKSLLCCFWLAGVVLVERAPGEEGGSAPDGSIIRSADSAAKMLPPPSRTGLSDDPNRGGISIANRSRTRHLQQTQQSAAHRRTPDVSAPRSHVGRVTSAVPARTTARTQQLPIGPVAFAAAAAVTPNPATIAGPAAARPAENPPADDPPAVPPALSPALSLAMAPAGATDDVPSTDELFPSLSNITLSEAARSESLRGEDIPLPTDAAQPYRARFGRFLDVSGYRGTPRPTLMPFALQYHPLYFEDPNLERCGIHHGCLTDAVSAVRFFGRVPLAPYLLGSQPPHCHVHSPGQCRSCQAYGCEAYVPPLNPQGAGWQAAMTVGFFFLFP